MIPLSNPNAGSTHNPTGEPGGVSPRTGEELHVRGLTPSGSPNTRLQDAKRSIAVDMSPEAIDQRLREYFQLWTFWTKLRRFQKVDPESSSSPQSISSPDSTAE